MSVLNEEQVRLLQEVLDSEAGRRHLELQERLGLVHLEVLWREGAWPAPEDAGGAVLARAAAWLSANRVPLRDSRPKAPIFGRRSSQRGNP